MNIWKRICVEKLKGLPTGEWGACLKRQYAKEMKRMEHKIARKQLKEELKKEEVVD